jgi:hypothetical protein
MESEEEAGIGEFAGAWIFRNSKLIIRHSMFAFLWSILGLPATSGSAVEAFIS